jgi:hypothetical protein
MSSAILYAKLAQKYALRPSEIDRIPSWLLSLLDGDGSEPVTA